MEFNGFVLLGAKSMRTLKQKSAHNQPFDRVFQEGEFTGNENH
jgi:hypothetical protein